MKQNNNCRNEELGREKCAGILVKNTKEIKKYFPYLLKEGSPLSCSKCGLVHREDGSLWRESIMGVCTRIPNIKLAKKERIVGKATEALYVLEGFLKKNFKNITIGVFEKNDAKLYWHQNTLLFGFSEQRNWTVICTDDDLEDVVKKMGLRKSHIEKRQRSL
jgi:hypothetical protein